MRRNLESLGGVIFSQRVLLALTQAGMSREDAYETVQRAAMIVYRKGGSFLDELKKDRAVTARLDARTLERLFDLGYHTRHVGTIFARVFGKDGARKRARARRGK